MTGPTRTASTGATSTPTTTCPSPPSCAPASRCWATAARSTRGSTSSSRASRPRSRALAAVPLPGIGSPIGGLIVFLEEDWAFDDAQRGLLEATARRAADAVRRIRVGSHDLHEDDPDADRRRTPGPPGSCWRTTRAPPATARRFLREFLQRAEVSDDVAATAELCLSELVTNAIVHAGGRSELRATLDTALTVSVRDHGGQAPDAAPDDDPDPLRVHGRGLQLVEALADRWGSERDALGTSVWFALELDEEARSASG